MYSRFCGSFKPTKELGPQIANSQIAKRVDIRKLPRLRMVRYSNKFCKSANLRICDLRNFIYGPPTFVYTRGLLLGCALTFASEAKFEIEAKISFRLEAKKKPDFT